ncbi:uncharacterized protein LOC143262193 [Megalopta genalis]|uniref:uncharacterized protein LOC143262193 n=1 Tax=Megalopta genalis TaxID=115081 RepID=UPI003FCF6D3D
MSEEVKKLVRQRTSFKAQLTRFSNSLNSEDWDLEKLEKREEKLEQLFTSFCNIQLEIETLEDNPECSDYIKDMKHKLPSLSESTVSLNSIPASSLVKVPSLLPKIQIKPFDGSYMEWNSFHDMFLNLVHENESIPAVHKFHLLKSYLRGDALTVIEALNATEENYGVAWSLLQKRFNNPRKIIHSHIRALHDLPEIDRNCPSALRGLADCAEMNINALRSLKEPVD